jgi:hypothetical protein
MYVDGKRTGVTGVCDDTPEAIADEVAFLTDYYDLNPTALEVSMKQLIGVTPADIESQVQPAEQLVIELAVAKINAELMRQRYHGPEPFEVYLADHLTPNAIREVVKPYLGHWNNPRIERREEEDMFPQYWFILTPLQTQE